MRKGKLLFSSFIIEDQPQLVELMLVQIKFQLDKILPEDEICLVPYIGTSPMFDSIPDDTSEEFLPEYDVTVQTDTQHATVTRTIEDDDRSASDLDI